MIILLSYYNGIVQEVISLHDKLDLLAVSNLETLDLRPRWAYLEPAGKASRRRVASDRVTSDICQTTFGVWQWKIHPLSGCIHSLATL